MRYLNNISLLGLVITILAGVPLVAQGEMSSTNYYIYADSIGFNGGGYATSSSYTLEDTANDNSAGYLSGGTYTLLGGYQASNLDESLSMTLTSASLDLGSLTTSSVSVASTTLIVSTNSVTGYSVVLGSVSGSIPPTLDVLDGTVTAGQDEYGIATTGHDAAFSDDESVADGLTIAQSSYGVSSVTTTLSFKASYNSTTPGSYSQSMVLTATANF